MLSGADFSNIPMDCLDISSCMSYVKCSFTNRLQVGDGQNLSLKKFVTKSISLNRPEWASEVTCGLGFEVERAVLKKKR